MRMYVSVSYWSIYFRFAFRRSCGTVFEYLVFGIDGLVSAVAIPVFQAFPGE
ncbi:MAG: hypothetical protein GF418_12450 [Chitinivibrionales bacterium]|nr:hypothetical protein [Chitinivibrionales bacterium]MBD3396430.1 hypothetical protein [Chitinivibrionales bacterium]